MNKNEILEKLFENGVIAVVRIKDQKKIRSAVDAIRLGGIKCIEITMTVPGALKIIREYVSMTNRSDYWCWNCYQSRDIKIGNRSWS